MLNDDVIGFHNDKYVIDAFVVQTEYRLAFVIEHVTISAYSIDVFVIQQLYTLAFIIDAFIVHEFS